MTRKARGALIAFVLTILGAYAPAAHADLVFSDAETVSSGASMFPATVSDLAVGGDGSVGVVTTSMMATGSATIREPGGNFTTPVPVASTFPGVAADMAIDDDGNALMVVPGATGHTWQYRESGGNWTSAAALNPPSSTVTPVPPRVAFLSDGSALAAWLTSDGKVEAATRAPGASSWSTPMVVAPATETASGC
jgi:hypothetical protein